MKKTYLFILLLVAVMASCSKSPEEVVTSVYQRAKDAKYEEITDLLYKGKEAAFTDEENSIFCESMKKFQTIGISTFTVKSCEENKEKGTAQYVVNVVYDNGDSETEKGMLVKNEDGDWQMALLTQDLDTLMKSDTAKIASADEDDGDSDGEVNQHHFVPVARFSLNRVLASRGNMEAEIAMGYYYMNSEYVSDTEKCVSWFEKAAKQGSTDAERMMGQIYFYGEYTDRDYDKAFKWFEKAAKKGDIKSIYFLGLCYQYGYGTDVDTEKARKYYRTAAEKGDADAQLNYGYLIETVDFNLEEAVKWYTKSAEKGNTIAQYNLGQIYRSGRLGIVDFGAAAQWYRKAADHGHAEAQNWLGLMYENGQGVEKNLSTAYKWYQAAADNGSVYGERNANRLAGRR